jgi:Holliday junction DNA helicase RuvB
MGEMNLTVNISEKEQEALQRAVEFESTAPKEEWDNLGWSWQQVGVMPATLNKLIVKQLIKVSYQSVRYTQYKLTPLGKTTFEEIKNAEWSKNPVSDVDSLEPIVELLSPEEMFADIIGYDDVKELLREVVLLDEQLHVLLAGPPAIAKTMFLNDIELALGTKAMWVVGSAASKAGVWDKIAERRPQVLLITELEKMAIGDTAGLLSLMEGGRLARVKVHRDMDVIVKVKIVADANRINYLPPELLSRFAVKKLEPYGPEDFQKVVKHVLVRREHLDEDAAARVALQLLGKTQDVRHAVRVGRLSKRVGVDKAIRLLN